MSQTEVDVLTPPGGLPEAALLAAVPGLRSVSYLPLGFGSHHWLGLDESGQRWFLTADDVGEDDGSSGTLADALATVAALRHLPFVVAPVAPPRLVARRWLLAVYPWLDVVERDAPAGDVGRMLAALHAATPPPQTPPHDPFAPARAVRDALAALAQPWGPGPHGEPARAALLAHAGVLDRAVAAFEALAPDSVVGVVTHGEPKPGNVVRTPDGPRLVDWDTVALAPRERDLWFLGDEAVAAYVAADGPPPDPRLLDLYRRRWALDDVAAFVASLRAPHGDTDDARASLGYLTDTLRTF